MKRKLYIASLYGVLNNPKRLKNGKYPMFSIQHCCERVPRKRKVPTADDDVTIWRPKKTGIFRIISCKQLGERLFFRGKRSPHARVQNHGSLRFLHPNALRRERCNNLWQEAKKEPSADCKAGRRKLRSQMLWMWLYQQYVAFGGVSKPLETLTMLTELADLL